MSCDDNIGFFRAATAADASYLVVLLDSASRGLVAWLWTTLASQGQSAMELGRSRIINEIELPSHFSNWTTVCIKDEIVGAIASYPLPNPYRSADWKQLPELYRPMLDLELKAVGSWYVMSLSVFPEYRNRGLGTAMLQHAERTAKEAGYKRLSIMVVSDNTDALRLYERFGFREIARKTYIPFPGSKDTGDWVLFMKYI